MSMLRAPRLGPIVGHTTDRSCRIWIRADDPADSGVNLDSERRTVGVIALFEGENQHIKTSYFRLHREFDRTGTFNLGYDVSLLDDDGIKGTPLKPDTEYTIITGTLTLDDPLDDELSLLSGRLQKFLPDQSVWEDELNSLPENRSKATFTTFPKKLDDLSFLLGSCRYPGLLWKAKRADKIFGPMRDEARKKREGTNPRFVIMAGDQIYADQFNRFIPLGRADTYAEFQERYLTAFGSPNMRRLLREVPTYMILDDHEIEDNWSQDRVRHEGQHGLFTLAIDAYMSYQWSHGPRTFGRRLFYTFECGGYPFFVLDTRTQRFFDDDDDDDEDLSGNHLLGYPSFESSEPAQIDRLLSWLENQNKNVPKFIVTSSVFAPNPMRARYKSSEKRKEECDSWPGFPKTRRAILNFILKHNIQNVVFLSGDIHCSNVAKIEFEDGEGAVLPIKMFSITSSAFYWPFPFADGEPSHYVHNSRHKGQWDPFYLDDDENGPVMHYRAWNFTQEDNYCRIDIDRANARLVVRTFDDDGSLVRNEAKKTDEGDIEA